MQELGLGQIYNSILVEVDYLTKVAIFILTIELILVEDIIYKVE